MRTLEEHKFETKLLQESLERQINRVIRSLEEARTNIREGRDPSWTFPKNDFADLTQRIGELSLMLRLYTEGAFDKEEEKKGDLVLLVNQKGLIPGSIRVDSIEDAEQAFSVLVDAQNLPGVGEFSVAILKDKNGKVIKEWEFDNYV